MNTLALTPTESAELQAHEQVIEAGLHNFLAVGNALLAINTGRLYRATYPTFEEYVNVRWNISRGHAYRLMNATQVLPTGDIPNENVARALGEIKDEALRSTVWQAAVGTFGTANVTAQIIKATKTVIETAEITDGHVDIGDGEMTPLAAAITAEAAEIANRQRQHILDNSNPPLYKESLRISQLSSVVHELVKHYGDREVRVIIYEVKA